MSIARQSELSKDKASMHIAEMALRLIDGYVLGLQTSNQVAFELEPVTLSSIFYDAAEELRPIARTRGYEIKVDVGGRFGPIMGNRRVLQNAFVVAGFELMSAPADGTQPILTLGSHKSKGTIVAGVFTNNSHLSADAFRRARALIGSAQQVLPNGSTGSGAGIFIADSLLKDMATPLRVAHHQRQAGLASTFLPSQQLRLV